MNQTGQVIIILLLVTLVSLAIGVSIVQNSVTEISTSSKTDQSTRAFSAAEAGIEKAIVSSTGTASLSVDFTSKNQSSANVTISADLPDTPGQALQYDSVNKADFVHFWLADPSTSIPAAFYTQPTFTLYFGNCGGATCSASDPKEKPAIEIDVVTKDSAGSYQSTKKYYDSSNDIVSRAPTNGFTDVHLNCSNSGYFTDTTSGLNQQFYCKVPISGYPTSPSTPMLVRIRLLYSSSPQKIALSPDKDSGNNNTSLPKQAKKYASTGTSGQTQRVVKVFKENDVVPYFLDFAIYSEGVLSK